MNRFLRTDVATLHLSLILALCLPVVCMAQPSVYWSKTWGGTGIDGANSVAINDQGGYTVVGSKGLLSMDTDDLWLFHVNEAGQMEWSLEYGDDSSWEYGNDLQQLDDGGFIVVGSATTNGSSYIYDILLIRTDDSGDTHWVKTIGNSEMSEAGVGVRITDDGGYIICGTMNSDSQIILLKTDSSGNEEWTKYFGDTGFNKANSIQLTSDGGFVILGATDEQGAGGRDMWLIKTDSDGVVEWSQTYGGSSAEHAGEVQLTSDGGYILAGHTRSFGDNWDFMLVKTDSLGNMEWQQTFGSINDDKAFSVAPTLDGGFVIAGYTEIEAMNRNMWLIKTDSTGSYEWERSIVEGGRDSARRIIQTSDEGFIVCGANEFDSALWWDAWLVKFSPCLSVENSCSGGFPVHVSTSSNPVSEPVAAINYFLPQQSLVELSVFDLTGRQVSSLVAGRQQQAGEHSVSWDTSEICQGVYLISLETPFLSAVIKVLIRH